MLLVKVRTIDICEEKSVCDFSLIISCNYMLS